MAAVAAQGADSLAASAAPAAERWFASHELRTALQAVRGGLDLLLGSAARGLSTSQLEAVSLIAGAATDLERHSDALAELWQLIQRPPPPAQRVKLRCLLASPSVAQCITPQPGLVAAWDGLEVRLQPEVATRAFEQLAELAEPSQAMPLDLIAAGPADIALELMVPPPSAGDRAIAWQLIRELCRHAGLGCTPNSETGCVLTLQLYAAATASDRPSDGAEAG